MVFIAFSSCEARTQFIRDIERYQTVRKLKFHSNSQKWRAIQTQVDFKSRNRGKTLSVPAIKGTILPKLPLSTSNSLPSEVDLSRNVETRSSILLRHHQSLDSQNRYPAKPILYFLSFTRGVRQEICTTRKAN